jgi:hypothetical protein
VLTEVPNPTDHLLIELVLMELVLMELVLRLLPPTGHLQEP